MYTTSFFEKQTELTASKTKIYEEYITGYLPRLLLSCGKCFIADLFCGPGKNGNKNGSPLILIDRIKYILSSPKLKNKSDLKIQILFNDQDPINIDNLKLELDKLKYNRTIINIVLRNEKYENLLPKLTKAFINDRTPKFFFLDPFTYSNVKMNDLRQLISLPYTEILLFLPVFHTYRFASVNHAKEHKTRKFIEEFTTKGIYDYSDIDAFLTSIKHKIIKSIKTSYKKLPPYVRYIRMDGKSSKNSLFLITGHQKAMLLMNQIAFRLTDDGNCLKVKDKDQSSLFAANESTLFHSIFKEKLISFIRRNQTISNVELIDFTIRECFLPKDIKPILKELTNIKKVSIFTLTNEIISDSRKWAISAEPKCETVIKWTAYEKN